MNRRETYYYRLAVARALRVYTLATMAEYADWAAAYREGRLTPAFEAAMDERTAPARAAYVAAIEAAAFRWAAFE